MPSRSDAQASVSRFAESGLFIHHSHGSHCYLKHSAKPTLRVTIPFHSLDLKRGTLQFIIKQAGLTSDGFLKLL